MPITPTNHTDSLLQRIRLPLRISVQPYLRDHQFNGKMIYPAAEILQQLAGSLLAHDPGAPVFCMRAASFDRFLQIGDLQTEISASHELEVYDNGHRLSRLLTTTGIPGMAIKRTMVHAAVDFTMQHAEEPPFPLDRAAALDGVTCDIPADTLYRELVPFGPAYRNVTGSLCLAEDGAIGHARAPINKASCFPLGSPFPFDAALHAACAWGQRFHGIVAFPVGFAKRTIIKPTVPGGLYRFRVTPLSAAGAVLRFDIRIYDSTGNLCEETLGMRMKDVSGGRVKPPGWIAGKSTGLAVIRAFCRAVSLVELQTVAEFAPRTLSPLESARYEKMGARRRRSFLAGRLALKYLSRTIWGNETAPADSLHTVMPDGIRPCCPFPGGQSPLFCSLSHDIRFAFAVAADSEIGVDVERISDRVLKTRRLFMTAEELFLTETSPLGNIPASLRVWSIKEGVAKAADMTLARAWREANITDIGQDRSELTVGGKRYSAYHDTVDDHLFTLVKKTRE